MDKRLRELQRKARASGAWEHILEYRTALKRAKQSADLDLSLPHSWNVVSGKLNRDCMGFWTVNKPKQDQLKALSTQDIARDCFCEGCVDLYEDARFARVCPK